jgi:integrase/recombinase XerD
MTNEWQKAVESFRQYLRDNSYNTTSLDAMPRRLRYFAEYAASRGKAEPCRVTRQDIENYQVYVYRLKKKDGKPLAVAEQYARINNVAVFFARLTRTNQILFNPATDLKYPKINRMLPANILTVAELKEIFAQPNTETLKGLRDRAIMELFYATGIRRGELLQLKVSDIDRARQSLYVKGAKNFLDRILPLTDSAFYWLICYVEKAERPDEEVIFTSTKKPGNPLDNVALSSTMRGYFKKAGIGKIASCHIFRHTCATHMLEGGAELRFIQVMLGHRSQEATQIYTKVSIAKLKEVHEKTHPANRSRRTGLIE